MIAKCFEIRDSNTFIPILAVKLDPDNEGDSYLLSRAGYDLTPMEQREYVQVIRISGGSGMSACDPHEWGPHSRTLTVAHEFIIEHFNDLEPGAVIDVEYILGEKPTKKRSERYL
jgi:hypothetical protein